MVKKLRRVAYFLFIAMNIFSSLLLFVWIYRNCLNPNSTFTSIVMDFFALITCIYSVIRVRQSRKGMFKVIDMVTIYYASLFFLFSWFLKTLYLIWDYCWTTHPDTYKLMITATVSVTLLINFYVTEKVNMDNLDKIEADLD
jgi:hypothetical protein